MSHALVLVDLQNDFLPGGALAVPAGNAVIPIANQLQGHFEHVVATQDWHPPNHGSFADNQPGSDPGDLITLNGIPQVLWPAHCVQHSPGAAFARGLKLPASVSIVRKGTDPTIDSYSGFYDNARRHATGLTDLLHGWGVRRLYLLGLATDYCVKFTALDAISLGFETYLVADGCRGVNLQPNDVSDAIAEMRAQGVTVTHSREVIAAESQGRVRKRQE